MRIETAGVASKKTGCKFGAIVKDGNLKESFVYDVNSEFTLNQIELLAVKFAIMGVDPDQNVTIATPSQYVSDMLKKGAEGWIRSPKSNVELINEIRDLLEERSVAIVVEKSEEAKDLCK